MFLPVEPSHRLLAEGILERIAREEGLTVLGLARHAGERGRHRPHRARFAALHRADFHRRRVRGCPTDELERKLYIVRKRAESEIAASDLPDKSFFYIPSLSSRTIIYKGLLLAQQIAEFYKELTDPDAMSALCLVHQRFSTNTFPSWQLAHPYRYLCHNGEINTIRGNINWMHAREKVLASDLFGDDLKKTFPVIAPGGSDSASLDNAVELLTLAGRSLPHVMAMLIPEAWDADSTMRPEKKAFYEYHASLMEPWDGPAAIAFTDGRVHRRHARSQRAASGALSGDARRPGDPGLGNRRASGEAGRSEVQGPAAARPHAAGGYRRRPHRSRRRDQGAPVRAASLTASG